MDEIAVGLGAESDQPFQLNHSGVAAHTAIFAQTGAGKSFLLGRYLEEILLKTRAKVVILDPNSDFLRFGHPSHPEEASGFAEHWHSLPLTILSNRDPAALSTSTKEPVKRIVMDWSKLTPTEQCRYLNFVTALDYQSTSP
jgi:DNA helicase HerA-like ATPase